jgi:glyoxylate utilization-related uncharacterized protein
MIRASPARLRTVSLERATDGARDLDRGALTPRVLSFAPGQCRPFVESDWVDAIVLVAVGAVDVVGVSGARVHFARGDLLWLAGLPVRALHNPGAGQAVLVAVSRAAKPSPQ